MKMWDNKSDSHDIAIRKQSEATITLARIHIHHAYEGGGAICVAYGNTDQIEEEGTACMASPLYISPYLISNVSPAYQTESQSVSMSTGLPSALFCSLQSTKSKLTRS